jgi:NADH-quinone oxidoreductase subunit J
MNSVFYLSAAVAIVSTLLMITRLNAVHALLYLILSLLSVAVIFYISGAPFAAGLELIIYAGAIMVLFIFVVMLLNLGDRATAQERSWLKPSMWVGPAILASILAVEVAYFLLHEPAQNLAPGEIAPKVVGIALFGPYVIGVELASMLLTAALVGAYHLGSRHAAKSELRGLRQPANPEAHDVDFAQSGIASRDDLVRVGNDRPAGAP